MHRWEDPRGPPGGQVTVHACSSSRRPRGTAQPDGCPALPRRPCLESQPTGRLKHWAASTQSYPASTHKVEGALNLRKGALGVQRVRGPGVAFAGPQNTSNIPGSSQTIAVSRSCYQPQSANARLKTHSTGTR